MIKQHYIDYLRAIAVVAVVTIHATSYFYTREEIGQLSWWLSNLLNSVSRFSVPLFVMISGAVLLGRTLSIGEFYRKRVARLLPPLIFWTFFYIGFSSIFRGENIISCINGVLGSGQAYFHLWYLSMFACLMIFAPFINKFLNGDKPTPTDLLILLVAMFFFFLLNGILSVAVEIFNIDFIGWFKIFPWYIAYFIGGYYLHRYYEIIKIKESFILTVIALLMLVGTVTNYYVANSYGIIKDYFVLNNAGPMVFIITFLIFLFFRKKSFSLKENKIISIISETSFGIYLIHPVFLYILRNELPNYDLMPLLYIPVTIIVTIFASLFSIILIRKITFMRSVC